MNTQLGKVYLIPTTLGDVEPLEVLPLSIKRSIEAINHYVVENEKTARAFIKKIAPKKSQPGLKIQLLNKYTDTNELPSFLDPCLEGHHLGVISEAGCPGVADPGAEIVNIAHRKNIQVIPLVGPSSILLALMASGMNGQSFAFNGYLPIDKGEKKSEIKKIEKRSKELKQSQIFIETPYRNNKLLSDFLSILNPHTKLCVACDLTLPSEFIKTQAVSNWKHTEIDLHKRPCIFIFQA
ncbi:SAM-dependent methyltransferase [Zhouia spongiae]|uniref:SAM-dependent methyltransferase n=1 Tax=Zhouia spongiae TaxID=2202721 RepID=A0ABY3YK93_9FLAO|nr:SAM-dependent methyltransferase [Zhouia spongiae]UNY98247.1 SAM-dependent methyltransferase [Zhouia spongiae]